MYMCIDIGGTNIKYGMADKTGKLTGCRSIPTEAKKNGGSGIIAKVKQLIAENQPVEGVAISTTGIVDIAEGMVSYALPKYMPGYSGTAWKKLIEAEFHVPCAVENDVNCAALGEWWHGAGRHCSSAFCMTIGTSIGGAFIHHGQVLHGASQYAGEIAFLRIPGGMLHERASGTALIQAAAQAKGIEAAMLDGKLIFEAAQHGDILMQEVIVSFAEGLADGITNVTAIVNPEVVILGGGIMAQREYLRPLLERALQKRLPAELYRSTKLAFAEQGNDAGMIGALYHLLSTI